MVSGDLHLILTVAYKYSERCRFRTNFFPHHFFFHILYRWCTKWGPYKPGGGGGRVFISSRGFQEPSLKIHWTFPEPTCRLSTRYTRLCWEKGVVVNVDHLSWKDTPDHLGELVQHCLSGCVFSSPWVTEPSEVSQAYLSNPYGVLSDFPLCEDWKTSFSQAARPLRTPGCYSPHLHPGGTRGEKFPGYNLHSD